MSIFSMLIAITLSNSANFAHYDVRKFLTLTSSAQMDFLYSAEDCRSSLLPERFPNVTSDLSDAFVDGLYGSLEKRRFPPSMDMFDVLDSLDRYSVHGNPILQAYHNRRPYEPQADLNMAFWTGKDDERAAKVEAWLTCRVRYFHVTPRRTVEDYVRLVDAWYGVIDLTHPRDVSAPRASAKVGDVLDRILAADDAAAKALRPPQTP